MKDKKQESFHVIPRWMSRTFPEREALYGLRRKPVRKSQVETWTVRPSIETPDQEEKIPEKKRKPLSVRAKRTIRRWIVVGVVTAAVAVSYLTITLQTYTGIEVVEQIQEARGGNSFYVRYGENILGCDADSVSLFNLEGKELWKEVFSFRSQSWR